MLLAAVLYGKLKMLGNAKVFFPLAATAELLSARMIRSPLHIASNHSATAKDRGRVRF